VRSRLQILPRHGMLYFPVLTCPLCGILTQFIQPAVPRTFPGGLEKELGGPAAVRARMTDDEESVL
jgi:NADH dehydrogenase (ubiquinone) 1 beta subcomplex subunit 8